MALNQSAGTQGSANSTTIAVTFGEAPPQNDIVILAIAQGANGNGGATCSGFSAIAGLGLLTLPTTTSYMSFLWKLAGASEPTTYTVTLNAGNWAAIQGWDFSGRNTTSPFTTTDGGATVANGTHPLSIPLGGVTAATGDDILWVASMGKNGVNYTFTLPSGISNQLNTNGGTSGSQLSMFGGVETNASSGATGTLTGSANWSGSNSDAAGAVISLAASGGSGTSISPSSGAATLTGNAPSMNLGINPLTARKAWDYTKGLLVPSRKIFLPPRPALIWEG